MLDELHRHLSGVTSALTRAVPCQQQLSLPLGRASAERPPECVQDDAIDADRPARSRLSALGCEVFAVHR
jgi:hypothetical protein